LQRRWGTIRKVGSYLLLLAVASAAVATPPKTFVREGFGGTQFPPPRWSVAGSRWGRWKWEQSEGAARGYVSAGFEEEAYGSLYTPNFHIGNARRLHLQFRYRTDGFMEVGRHVRIRDWYTRPNYTQSWRTYSVYTPTFPYAGYCRAEFQMNVTGGSHGTDGYWFVDDVVISLDNTGVEATSLGRVKTLYY
jgi:hypothetical protein